MKSDHDLLEYRRAALERALRKEIEGEVQFDDTYRKLYATDASIYEIEPLGVVLPRHRRDLQAAMQIAAEHHVPLVPRGGGTSLSGQAIGPGLVIDGSKHLQKIIEIDPERQRCRVQPGVILSNLNRELAPYRLLFGPDVSTANRATLGGMIGNNSAGAHSLVYGKTVDHTRALDVLLADGSPLRLQSQATGSLAALAATGAREARLALEIVQLVRAHEAEIDARFPKIMRRVSGYNFPEMLAQCRAGEINLASLVVGSEGTLTVIAEAELALVPLPAFRGLLVPHFSSLRAALDQVLTCLEGKPAAVELIDQMILDLAADNLALRRQMAAIQGRPAAILMVEVTGESLLAVRDQLDRLTTKLQNVPGLTALVRAETSDTVEPLWRLREAGLPLLMGLPGDRKPVTFVEDTAVAPDRLPEFATRFADLIRAHGTRGAFYGHASVGCLHIRPILNLKDAADVATMRKISAAVVDLVREFDGSLSGEHGDGLARSEWNRTMFGDELYAAFQRVKHLFDPEHRLNPGKIVNAPPMTESLRFGPDYHAEEPATLLDFSHSGGIARHVELCSGTGVCRKTEGGMMCPSYRATMDEMHSTRGRANALRWALKQGNAAQDLRSPWMFKVLDLCLSCKACKAECPSNVDLAKLKAEVTEVYYQNRGRPLSHWMLARLPTLLRLASSVSPLVNRLSMSKALRWLMGKTLGIDARRSLPPIHRQHFRRWFRSHSPSSNAGQRGRVLLLDDCFTSFQEPQIGKAAVALLEQAGFQVDRLGLCCGRPLFSKGMLSTARRLVRDQASGLAARLSDGVPILGIEPSCLLSLVDEWPELVPGTSTAAIARSSFLLDQWLAGELNSGRVSLQFRSKTERAALHTHCHQRALVGSADTADLLRRVPGLEVEVLDTGCCGMAGTFGYETEHYDLSVRIAELSLLPALAARPQSMVLAPGTSCRHQIGDLTRRQALHPLQLLAAQVIVGG